MCMMNLREGWEAITSVAELRETVREVNVILADTTTAYQSLVGTGEDLKPSWAILLTLSCQLLPAPGMHSCGKSSLIGASISRGMMNTRHPRR